MPTTERLILPVHGNVDGWKDSVKLLLQTLKNQDGYLRTRWGPHSEDESKLEFLIGWESFDAQKKFQESFDYQTVQKALGPILAGTPTSYFVAFQPYAPKEVIDSALVEVLTLTSLGENVQEDDLRAAIAKYKDEDGCTGVASGFASGLAASSKTFVAVIGWSSMEASEKSRKGKNTSSLAGVDGKMDVHHVNFRYPVKGFRGL